MIFDRISDDVVKSKELIATKVSKFIELTENEVAILEKGTLTINTINRIESKQGELQNLLNQKGYWSDSIQTKQWALGDVFFDTDLQRIVNNTNTLRKAFFVYRNTPQTPNAKYHFSNINSLEKILYDIEEMIAYMVNNYKECGTVECGERG